MKKIYLLGDILKQGSQLMRKQEAEALRALGYEVFSPAEQMDINDKTKQTEETNNKLAERIVEKDMQAIRKAEIIIAEVDNNNVGSTAEMGAIMEFNWWWDKLALLLEIADHRELKGRQVTDFLWEFLYEHPYKTVYCHTTDIRHTDLNEKGMRRSFSINQFLHGVCLKVSACGIVTFKEILRAFKGEQ